MKLKKRKAELQIYSFVYRSGTSRWRSVSAAHEVSIIRMG